MSDDAILTEMSVILRNVISRNWGWFSRENERMHLQTLDDKGQPQKVWLEERGQRVCEPAADCTLPGSELKKLREKVQLERSFIELRWINFMIAHGWLIARLDGSIVTLTAYPRTHNAFERQIELRDVYPGAYSKDVIRTWEALPIVVSLDAEHCCLVVGDQRDEPDDRNRLRLTDWVFVG